MERKWQLTVLVTASLLLHTYAAVTASIPFYCLLDEMQCPSNIKQCIQILQLCNGIKDCADGSDENAAFCKSYGCNGTDPFGDRWFAKRSAKCPSGNMCTKTAVFEPGMDSKPWLCTGGQKDCADGSDEDPRYCETLARNCSLNAQGLFDKYHRSVADTCPSKKYCVEKGKLCDGKKDCPDGSDEWPSFCTNYTCPYHPVSFSCKDWGCLTSDNQMCDGVKDCGDGSDEDPAFCAEYKCLFGEKKCSDGRTCLSESQICDGIKNCPDGSDEEESFCRTFECPGFKYKCKDGKQCAGEVGSDLRCSTGSAGWYNVDLLCKDKSDANNSFCVLPVPNCNDTATNIRCPGGVGCVAKTSLCNGRKDCEDGSDEGEFCKSYNCTESRRIDPTVMCKNTLTCTPGSLCNGFADCTDGSDEDPVFCQDYKCPQGYQKCKDFPYQCVYGKFLCDGTESCINGGDEDKELCRDFECYGGLQKCPNYPYQCIDPNLICDGKKDCNDGGDEDPNFCKDFKCLEGSLKCPNYPYKCIPSYQLCNGHRNCVNGGDEDPEFCKTDKCHDFGYIKCPNSSTYQCVEQSSLCNGYKDCRDGSDEDSSFCNTYECPGGQQKCPNDPYHCTDSYNLCNGNKDCANGGDEDPAFCQTYECPDYQIKCPRPRRAVYTAVIVARATRLVPPTASVDFARLVVPRRTSVLLRIHSATDTRIAAMDLTRTQHSAALTNALSAIRNAPTQRRANPSPHCVMDSMTAAMDLMRTPHFAKVTSVLLVFGNAPTPYTRASMRETCAMASLIVPMDLTRTWHSAQYTSALVASGNAQRNPFAFPSTCCAMARGNAKMEQTRTRRSVIP